VKRFIDIRSMGGVSNDAVIIGLVKGSYPSAAIV
jgi:hypothetical protein